MYWKRATHASASRFHGTLVCLIILGLGLTARLRLLTAADPAFVGVISILESPETADALELTEQQRLQLEALIRRRETAAVELAMQARQLPVDERERKQALFVAESEREGLALLNDRQRELLARLGLRHEGMQSVLRDDVAQQLELNDAQRGQIVNILDERQTLLDGTEDPGRQRTIRSVFDKRIEKVLDASQKRTWTAISNVSNSNRSGPADVADASVPRAGTSTVDEGPLNEGLQRDVDGRLQFNFEYAPWKTVLQWFAEQAKLSLVMDAPPPGSFNLSEPRKYAPEEALDVINSVLLTKGYTLVRRESMLILVNLEDGIPPNLVTTVRVQDLDARGEFELVSTLFRLGKVSPESAEQEIQKLLGPQGSMHVLGTAKQLFVTETAGRLRTIREVLQAMENPDAVDNPRVTTFELTHIMPEEAFGVLRPMLGLPDESNASADGSLRMTTDVLGERIMVTGPSETIEQIRRIVELIDVPLPSSDLAAGGIAASPQLEVYAIVAADSDSVLQVLQTLLTDEEVRLAIDPKTGNLIALALPTQHALIRATLSQMQQGGQAIEVIRLRYVDPQIAVLAINQLFGAGEEGNSDAPKVNADVTTGQLLVRGSQTQISQIRSLLDKMGEGDASLTADQSDPKNVRVVPLNSTEAHSVLEQLQQIWPAVRSNRIRTVVPSAVIRAVRSRAEPVESSVAKPANSGSETRPNTKTPSPADNRVPAGEPKKAQGSSDSVEPESGFGSKGNQRLTGRLMAQVPTDSLGLDALLGESEPQPSTRTDADNVPMGEDDVPGADIVVAIGSSGLIVASRDSRALDEFEQLVASLSGGGNNSRDFAVFYLKHATATAATQILNSVLGGDSSADSSDGGSGGGLLDLAGLGDGGDLMGSLLGLGGGDVGSLTASGSYSIVPEPRLNLLVVQANASDMQLIEQLLEIIDQRRSPELVQTVPQPRLIPVYFTSAESIAGVVREVFANQLASGAGQQRQPSPEDFIRALRGGRGGRGGGSTESAQDEPQLTVGVDARGNQLVVAAPDDLFQQVVSLVRQLDQEDPESAEMTRVITLDRANPELVRRALATIVGTPATQTLTNGASSPPSPAVPAQNGAAGRGTTPNGRQGRSGQDFQQQMEIFRALRGGAGRGAEGGGRGRGGRGAGRGGAEQAGRGGR